MADAFLIPSEARPTVEQLGQLMRARTKDRFGNEIGSFNADTRPTADQAQAMIDMAVNLIPIDLATTRVEYLERAQQAVLLLAAMLVESSYFPEQAESDQSPLATYERLYNQALGTLTPEDEEGRFAPTTLA